MEVSSGYLETRSKTTLHYLRTTGPQKPHKTSIRPYVIPWFQTSAAKYMKTAINWATMQGVVPLLAVNSSEELSSRMRHITEYTW
jgi:hypothetical protein